MLQAIELLQRESVCKRTREYESVHFWDTVWKAGLSALFLLVAKWSAIDYPDNDEGWQWFRDVKGPDDLPQKAGTS